MRQQTLEEASRAAFGVARQHGLRPECAVLEGGYSNAIVRLEPYPLIARVADLTESPEFRLESLRREVIVATALTSAGANVVGPSALIPAGPHITGHFGVTFWEYARISSKRPSPSEAGKCVLELHEDLDGCELSLPVLPGLDHAWEVLGSPVFASQVSSRHRSLISRSVDRVRTDLAKTRMSCRSLHGDAHHGNLWDVQDQWVWGDFEDSCSGPLEWDLACLTTSSIVLGSGIAAAEALRAYERPFDLELLGLLNRARTLQALAWASLALPRFRGNDRVKSRLRWLAAHQ